ncbi:MAG: thioredoxin family protein, partial [Deefgea sp.]
MLDANITAQLSAYLEKLQHPIELIASLDDSAAAGEISQLINEIAVLNSKISVRFDGNSARKPSFAIARVGEAPRVSFAGIPLGHEFTSLILALLQTGGHPPRVDDATIATIKSIKGSFEFTTFISLSCHNCPDVVQALNLLSVLNPNIRHEMVDGALYQAEVTERQIMAVPTILLNGQAF